MTELEKLELKEKFGGDRVAQILSRPSHPVKTHTEFAEIGAAWKSYYFTGDRANLDPIANFKKTNPRKHVVTDVSEVVSLGIDFSAGHPVIVAPLLPVSKNGGRQHGNHANTLAGVEALVADMLQHSGSGHVVLTTRNPWGGWH
jgi:hypothetical protein